MKVKAAVINEVDSPYVIEELTLSDIREDEILVKMVASGIWHWSGWFGCNDGCKNRWLLSDYRS